MDIIQLGEILALTTILTTASTYIIVSKVTADLCKKIDDLAVRLGVVEKLEGK